MSARFASARSCAIALLGLATLLLAAPAASQTRPSTLALLPGVVTLENVQYAAGTSPDLTQPAAGTCRLVVTAGGFTVGRDGVTFTNLLFDAQGQLQGVVFTLDQKLEVPIAGATIEIPSGEIRWRMPDGLSFAGPGVVTFPFRNPDGTPITARAGSMRALTQGGATQLALDSLILQGPAGTNGVAFPGVRIAAAPWNLKATWTGSAAATWEVTFPTARVFMGIPGLASAPEPIEASATNLRIKHTGDVSFDSATLAADRIITPVQLPGFTIKIRSGTVAMTNSVPSFQAIVADLTFPPGVTNVAGTGPAILLGLDLNLNAGLVLDIPKSFEARIGEIRLASTSMALDLSNAVAPGGPIPPDVGRPSWMGVWFKVGTLRVPLGTNTVEVQLGKFFVDAHGLSGETTVSSGIPSLDLEGFGLTVSQLKLGFLRSQIVSGTLAGRIGVPRIGNLDARVEFSLRGLEAIALRSANPLDLSDELGLSLRNVKGSLALGETPAMLRLSGTLKLNDPSLETKVSNLRIDGAGRIYLPEEGVLTLNDPAVVHLGVLDVEVRRVGFTSPNGLDLEAVSFTGTARLTNAIEGMSLGGEIDLEHFTVKPGPPGQPPAVEIGGLGIEAQIPQLGTIGASLKMSDDLPGFQGTQVLYGDAVLALEPLNNVGLNVTFLVAPDRQAWFIGGDAMLPEPVRVDIPATPAPTPMIPLFQIKGFLGGFGLNVAPLQSGPGIGPIKEPEIELKYSGGTVMGQAGLMLAEYAAGDRVWWADATLTATFNPTMFDLTGRMALLDLAGVTGFPSNSQWRERDRIARVFVNLDLDARPSFSMGGDLDMNFPTRSFALVDASGEALMRFASVSPNKTEAYLRVGCWWCDDPQRAMRIRVAAALEDYVELSGKVGMNLDFTDMSGEMRFDTKVEFKPIKVDGTMKGTLTFSGVRSGELTASGRLRVDAVADFDVVEASVKGEIAVRCTPSRVTFDGTLAGKVGFFEGEVDVEETFE